MKDDLEDYPNWAPPKPLVQVLAMEVWHVASSYEVPGGVEVAVRLSEDRSMATVTLRRFAGGRLEQVRYVLDTELFNAIRDIVPEIGDVARESTGGR